MERRQAETEVTLSLHGVRKSLPGFSLGPVDLDVQPGYVVALVGPNGSGKSTLLRMLPRFVHPDAGEIRLFGQLYDENEVTIKRRIGYIPDVPVGHESLDADDLANFIGHWYPDWDPTRCAELFELLSVQRNKRFAKLSQGIRRRTLIAICLATRAPLLVMDEPIESLDPLVRRTVLDEISEYVADGDRSVLFSTHVLDDVKSVADYVAFIHEGRFLGMYEKDEMMQNWKAIWVSRPPAADVPGVVSVQEGTPTRLVTGASAATEAAVRAEGVDVVRTAALDLDEILAHLTAGRATTGVQHDR